MGVLLRTMANMTSAAFGIKAITKLGAALIWGGWSINHTHALIVSLLFAILFRAWAIKGSR